MQDHEVAGTHDGAQPGNVSDCDLLVVDSLGGSERATVAGRAVEVIVDALGDLEVSGIALDDQPARVDPDAAGVREQRLQELGDTAAARSGVHVDDASPVEPLTGARCRLRETVGALGADERGQSFRRDGTDIDLEERFRVHRGLEHSARHDVRAISSAYMSLMSSR